MFEQSIPVLYPGRAYPSVDIVLYQQVGVSKVPIICPDMFAGWHSYTENQIHLSVWFSYPFTIKHTQMIIFFP